VQNNPLEHTINLGFAVSDLYLITYTKSVKIPPTTMKAIVISASGPVENLIIKDDIPKPTPTPGTALVKIRAFGINHAEMHMRRGEWAESVPISGIECVGVVEDCPGGEIPVGTPVAALMGGLGRTIPGSYAEYTVAMVSNVVALADTEAELPLPWAEIAALPESYATAWTCLFRNLGLRCGQRLLIRGATSSFGRAAINLAVEAGAIITATTRSEAKFDMLRDLGVTDVVREGPPLAQRLKDQRPDAAPGDIKFDCVLELVGNSTVVESLTLVKRGGHLCLAGWLGGLDPIPGPPGAEMGGFNPLLQMASGVHFSFFGSFVFGTDEFPLSDVPLREIVQKVADGRIKHAKPWRTFGFGEIREAHRVMEDGAAGGKMVVVVGSE
jgi:NADPH:quinone reductase-like Zn-dependent oxidoreductase